MSDISTGASCADQPLAGGNCTLLPDKSEARFTSRLPLPGVVIFVHGVNSDGEWYDSAEEGLCAGLNTRLKRRPLRMPEQEDVTPFIDIRSGLMTPVEYMAELTAEGFLNPKREAENFIKPDPNYSPVIRFRWGYKCSKEDVQAWGESVWLNEFDYWGGGPFANGCSTVPDLWGNGVDDSLFLWITAQHLNPAIGRDVYTCPSRTYYVHAALRLAKLIKSIRDKQQDCPITVVCHSQGNVVGVAAAFLADKLGVQADSYILANPPLSLVAKNFTESYVQMGSQSPDGTVGRQSFEARIGTMKNYLALLRERAGCAQPDAMVDLAMSGGDTGANAFKVAEDRKAHGYHGAGGPHTLGRVTLYCNPHDQVISASPVQGMGWRGVSAEEMKLIDPTGDVFSQRVFASRYEVGSGGGKSYNYWTDRWNYPKDELGNGNKTDYNGFWHPPSPTAKYSLKQGLESSRSLFGKFFTVVGAVLVMPALAIAKTPINADPPKKDGAKQGDWVIPINAPELPVKFLPKAKRYGNESEQFDEAFDPSGNSRDKTKTAKSKDDPYDQHQDRVGKHGQSDGAMGTWESEAQQRYEDRARLRMEARRKGFSNKAGDVLGETADGEATPEYLIWRQGRIGEYLKEGIDIQATDHSTIVTNKIHAERALSYDVALGVCKLKDEDWRELRTEADWRYSISLDMSHPHRYLGTYFETGLMSKLPLPKWIEQNSEAKMPGKIIDHRVWKKSVSPGEAA